MNGKKGKHKTKKIRMFELYDPIFGVSSGFILEILRSLKRQSVI